jgi:hypothetical protein
MSTTHDEAMIEKECQGQRVNKPKVAIDYNNQFTFIFHRRPSCYICASVL